MDVVIVTSYKTRKAAEKYAAALAFMDDGQYWNGREHVQVGSLDFRVIKYGPEYLVVRNVCVYDAGQTNHSLSI
jgi:hypothetical protein